MSTSTEPKTAQILRSGITPIWGLKSGTATLGNNVALLVNSANVSTETSTAEQVDSEGRKCGYICYDCWQTISISGNIIYHSFTDNFEKVAEMFTVGAAVSSPDAIALLDSVRVTQLNGCQATGDGTYIVKTFDINQNNASAVEFSLTVDYMGYSIA